VVAPVRPRAKVPSFQKELRGAVEPHIPHFIKGVDSETPPFSAGTFSRVGGEGSVTGTPQDMEDLSYHLKVGEKLRV
jgi:hypothetical protein